jgi:hypothetical protein
MTLTVKEPRRRVFERSRARTAGGHAALLTQAGGTTRDGQTKRFCFPRTKGGSPEALRHRDWRQHAWMPAAHGRGLARRAVTERQRRHLQDSVLARAVGKSPSAPRAAGEGVAAGLTYGSALCSACRCGALVASLSRCSWSRSVKTQDSRLTHPSSGSATPSTAAHPCLPVCLSASSATSLRPCVCRIAAADDGALRRAAALAPWEHDCE